MKPDVGGGILLHKAGSPLVDEAELQAVLEEAKATAPVGVVEGTWHTVRLLASIARHTLQTGRGDLALPLITTALELCPQPFKRLALLQQENEGCALVNSMPTMAELREIHGGDVLAVICTAIIVWHGASASASAKRACSCPRSFLRFSHRVGHVITQFAGDATTLESLSACWLYNTLAFAQRCRETEAVAFYLMEEVCGGERLLDVTGTDKWQLLDCSFGRNVCLREGLRSPQSATMWNRLCMVLYSQGCALLHAAQEEVCRSASSVIDILHRAFDGELTFYMTDFRRPLLLSLQEAAVLCDSAASGDMCVPRETFAPLRVACFLNRLANDMGCSSSLDYPLTSLSSVVALAQRHRHHDIAMEVLQAGFPVNSHSTSLVVWGKELEFLLENAVERPSPVAATGGGGGAQDGIGWKRAVWRRPGTPAPLLHEALHEGLSVAEVLRTFVSSNGMKELLPVAVAVLRGDSAFRHRLLGDKIAPSLVIEGLARLVVCLLDEGDVPLARCFLPLVAGISVCMPSQANLLVTIETIAAFAECCPDNGRQWESLATTFSALFSPRRSAEALVYRQTKTILTGRTFSTRRRVFETLCGDASLTVTPHTHCLIQLLLLKDQKEVHLLRFRSDNTTSSTSSSGSSGTLEGWATRWEKTLPIGEALLGLVARMQTIEMRNRSHLGEASCREASASSMSGDPSCRDGKLDETLLVNRDLKGAKDRADWWEKRRALDRAIGDVVEVMQSEEAFGCWRLFMCGDLPPSCQLVVRRAALQLLQELHAAAQHVEDVMMMLAGVPFMRACSPPMQRFPFNPSHVAAGHELCTSCDGALFNVALALESMLLSRGIATPSDAVFDASREACLCVLAAMWSATVRPSEEQQQEEDEEQSCVDHVDLFNVPRTLVYLLLDNELHCLPFEGMDVLRSGSVSRVPTAGFVSSARGSSVLLDNGLAYCVMDPAGVMPKTSKRLLPTCQRRGWLVNSQKLPPGQLLRELYSSGARLYVYVGHGRGEGLLHRGELYERFPDLEHFPAVFLMGCSSAYMDGGPSYDCYGMPYALLHAGCPLFLGCLWHVTDGEIDRLTKRLLSLIAGDRVAEFVRRPGTIGEALALARRSCKLPYLTGCATVLYGMNLSLWGDN